MENKKICMVGLGYIGLPTAVILANHNIDVLGYDINSSVKNPLIIKIQVLLNQDLINLLQNV